MIKRSRSWVLLLGLTLPSLGQAVTPVINAAEGHINFFKPTDSSDDSYTQSLSQSTIQFMNQHFVRMKSFSPYWDTKLSSYPNVWFYFDSYAIYSDPSNTTYATLIQQHPDYVLKDASGNKLYISYACSGGTCTQYAANITNPNGYRAWWIATVGSLMSSPSHPTYKGLFIDDVNLDITRISDGNGNAVTPIDPNTGSPMSNTAWKTYFADFMEQVRAAFPNTEIAHNSIWFVNNCDPTDAQVQRQIRAADFINAERGVNDSNVRGSANAACFSFESFLNYVDNLHSNGKGVVFDGELDAPATADLEYNAAAYLLVSSGKDMVGNVRTTPTNWWTGYDMDLGAAKGARYQWNGVWRRDFASGITLVNPFGNATTALTLPGSYTRSDNSVITSLTLAAGQGAILKAPASAPNLCDINGDSAVNVIDVQLIVNQAVHMATCSADLNKDGQCNVLDVQILANSAKTGICAAQ